MSNSAETRAYARLLAESFARVVGRDLIPGQDGKDDATLAQALRDLARPLVSHGTEADPIFRYANTAALSLWEMDWDRFTRLPSRLSAEAEPDIQGDRARLLAAALAQAFTRFAKGSDGLPLFNLSMPADIAVQAAVIATVAGVLAAVAPARRAAALDPAQAIRL